VDWKGLFFIVVLAGARPRGNTAKSDKVNETAGKK
jgi:hypothetical protein